MSADSFHRSLDAALVRAGRELTPAEANAAALDRQALELEQLEGDVVAYGWTPETGDQA